MGWVAACWPVATSTQVFALRLPLAGGNFNSHWVHQRLALPFWFKSLIRRAALHAASCWMTYREGLSAKILELRVQLRRQQRRLQQALDAGVPERSRYCRCLDARIKRIERRWHRYLSRRERHRGWPLAAAFGAAAPRPPR